MIIKIYKDILRFEGEYLNGEKNGKAKKYYYDGKLMFEGEYLNGKIWNGKGLDSSDGYKLDIKYIYVNGNKMIINK